MIRCTGCGGELHFDPAQQKLICSSCGSSFDEDQFNSLQEIIKAEASVRPEAPEKYQSKESKEEKKKSKTDNGFDTYSYTCPQCGGTLYSTSETAATFCSFCGASVLLEEKLVSTVRPDRIIPFQITKEEAQERYKKTVRRAVFAPEYLRKQASVEKFRGIYMPYWQYTYGLKDKLFLKGSKSYDKGNYSYTDHYRITTDVEASYEGISYDASSTFSDALSEGIAPFDEVNGRNFKTHYMAGFYADSADLDKELYMPEAAGEGKEFIARNLEKDPEIRRFSLSDDKIEKAIPENECEAKLGMHPVWFLSTRNSKNRISYAVVNGQTGKVAADLPISFTKYLIGSLLLAIPIFLILNLLVTLSPVRAMVTSFILDAIGLLILNDQFNRTYTTENKLDDKGFLAKTVGKEPQQVIKQIERQRESERKKKKSEKRVGAAFFGCLGKIALGIAIVLLVLAVALVGLDAALLIGFLIGVGAVIFAVISITVQIILTKMFGNKQSGIVASAPREMKMPSLIKSIAGLVICGIVYLVNPVQDIYFYGAAIIAMLLTCWSVFDIIRQHNQRTTRELPQFKKRGGDYHA